MLARIHSLFEKHRMEIEELIDPRTDKVTHSMYSFMKNDLSKQDNNVEETSRKEVEDKENGSMKERSIVGETVLEPRLIKHVTREMNEELFSRGKAIPGKLYYHEVKSSFKCVVKKGNKRAIRSLVRTK
ncbi:hypothetical protein Tco_0180876 [Tanacetum coccineum]